MKRIKLTVAYDGTTYHGWQVQPGVRTIEGELNAALTGLLCEPVTVIGASRTDAGVHALGNVAVFDTDTRIPADKLCFALNQRLPEDIIVQNSCQVERDFHPRHCESRKTYEYKILNRGIPLPLHRHDTYFYYRPLALEQMQQAAEGFVGEHDFKSFCSVHAQVESTVRRIYELKVTRQDDDIICIGVTGNGFLYNMIRILAGTLIQVGIGERRPQDIPSMIAARNRAVAGPTAPAKGLTLVGIEYKYEK